ncbi:MAG: hypothetical protein QOG53_1478 [Frankiales bacterium]|jgi:uncharacterized protein (TIGR02611 family)|nr:hypothetical protein [Frankiales bacterium]
MVMRHIRRGLIAILGLAVVALGIVLLPLPGPGFLVIAAGLAILATEFEWAERWLDQVRDRALEAAEQATKNWWSATLTVLSALGMLAVGIYIFLAPPDIKFMSKGTGIGVIIGALAALATAIYAIRTPGYGTHPPHHKESETESAA